MSLNQESLKDKARVWNPKLRTPRITVSSKQSKRVPRDKSLESLRKQFGKKHAVVYFSELKVKGKKVADVDLHYYGKKEKPLVVRVTFVGWITRKGKRMAFESDGMDSWKDGMIRLGGFETYARGYLDTQAKYGVFTKQGPIRHSQLRRET